MVPYSPSRDRDGGRYGVTAQNTRLAIRHDECNPIPAHPSPVLSPQIFSSKGSICVISSFFFYCALHLSGKLDQIVSRGDRGPSVTCMYLHHIRHYACSNQCISLSCWLTRTDAGHSHCKMRQCNCSSPHNAADGHGLANQRRKGDAKHQGNPRVATRRFNCFARLG